MTILYKRPCCWPLSSLILLALMITSCANVADETKGEKATSSANSRTIKGNHNKRASAYPDFKKDIDIKEISVAFYNVENLFDTQDDRKKKDDDFTPDGRNEWTNERYQTKLNHLTEVFIAMKVRGELPALIGLAEIENEAVLEDLVDRLLAEGADYGIAHEESKDMRGIDVAMLYRRDLITPLDEEAMRITFTQKGYTSRDILHFTGGVYNGEVVHAFVNHWPSRRGGWRETEQRRLDAAERLKGAVDDVLSDDEGANILIVGDFNDYPDNKSMEEVLGADKRAEAKNRLSNLAYPFEKKGLGTYNYQGDWGMLDQAIVSGALLDGRGLDVADEGLEIFQRDFMMYYDRKAKEQRPNRSFGGPNYFGGYSDHLPILLHLKVDPR